MIYELKLFALKLLPVLAAAPIMVVVIMVCGEKFEQSWKTNNRRKKWLSSCGLFLLLAAISGWLR